MLLGRDTNRDTNWRLLDVLEVADGGDGVTPVASGCLRWPVPGVRRRTTQILCGGPGRASLGGVVADAVVVVLLLLRARDRLPSSSSSSAGLRRHHGGEDDLDSAYTSNAKPSPGSR